MAVSLPNGPPSSGDKACGDGTVSEVARIPDWDKPLLIATMSRLATELVSENHD